MNPLIVAVFIGSFTVTAYQSIPSQTDSSPYWTANGERVNSHGVAVSPDLLKKNGGPLNFGDAVYIEGIGFKYINDVMAARHKRRIDVWVKTYADEKKFQAKWKCGKTRLYKVEKKS